MKNWVSNTISRTHKQGIDGLIQSFRYPYIQLLQQFKDFHGTGVSIYERNWDLLIVLDACRLDLMRSIAAEYSYISDVGSMRSVGSVTKEWMANTFIEENHEEMAQTMYICGNPHSETELDAEQFAQLDEVWRDAWTNTMPPRAITDRAISSARENPSNRLLVHYMQPHCPFIPWGNNAQSKFRNSFGNQGSKDVWQKLRDNQVTKEEVWKGYRENLVIALDEVELLLDNIDAENVVITSDHGNMMGEWGIYGHKPSLPFAGLRQVPWIETTATDNRTHDSSYDFETRSGDSTKKEKLAALGYL